jgi:hypothetical protein
MIGHGETEPVVTDEDLVSFYFNYYAHLKKRKKQVSEIIYLYIWDINHLHWAEGKNLSLGP